MKVYVASSWRNAHQPAVVEALRIAGHEVYDFRNPRPGNDGFHWTEIDPAWKEWTPEQLRVALGHPVARAGFDSDMDALRGCDACVLVLPCGRSAHLELGWACGQGKATAVLMLAPDEPELMYRMVDAICTSPEEVDCVPRAGVRGLVPRGDAGMTAPAQDDFTQDPTRGWRMDTGDGSGGGDAAGIDDGRHPVDVRQMARGHASPVPGLPPPVFVGEFASHSDVEISEAEA